MTVKELAKQLLELPEKYQNDKVAYPWKNGELVEISHVTQLAKDPPLTYVQSNTNNDKVVLVF